MAQENSLLIYYIRRLVFLPDEQGVLISSHSFVLGTGSMAPSCP